VASKDSSSRSGPRSQREISEIMHSISITRERGYIFDRLRPYNIFVDGSHVVRIREGETTQITVPPGVHTVTVKLDWCHSRPFTINAATGKSTALWCWPNVRIYNWPFYLLFAWNHYIALSAQPKPARASARGAFRVYQIVVVLSVLAYLGYESVLGKALAIALLVALLILVVVWIRAIRAAAATGIPDRQEE
jgi:hypothetical protein